MKYSVNKEEKYTILRLNEEKLDTNLAPQLKSEFVTLHAEGVKNIILDMAEVKYTDSSGLSALLVGNRTIQQNGGMFVLACLSDHVMKLIKISQLDGVLNILPTVQESVDVVFMSEMENDLNAEDSEN